VEILPPADFPGLRVGNPGVFWNGSSVFTDFDIDALRPSAGTFYYVDLIANGASNSNTGLTPSSPIPLAKAFSLLPGTSGTIQFVTAGCEFFQLEATFGAQITKSFNLLGLPACG
jgi:hypothetical protein